jgi:hypothetical protein
MTTRTDNPMRWTAMEYVAVYLPLVLLGVILLPQLCCQFNAVKFDFPASVSTDDRTAVERRPTTQPQCWSMTERVVNEDAVIDAVIDDLMREETHE